MGETGIKINEPKTEIELFVFNIILIIGI